MEIVIKFKQSIIATHKRCKSKFRYDFEQIILKVTELGLGTYWMAGRVYLG